MNGTKLNNRQAIIQTALVPVVHGESIKTALSAVDEHKPCVVLMLGLAPKRPDITPECVAINMEISRLKITQGIKSLSCIGQNLFSSLYYSLH